jgi:hypothetical protein
MDIDVCHTGSCALGMPRAPISIQGSEIVSIVHDANIYRVGIPVNTCLVDYQKGIVRDNAKMKSISEIRRDNLIDICQSFFDGNQEKLAGALGRDKNVISRVMNPNHSQPREIGNSLARSIEASLKLEQNWLDNTHHPCVDQAKPQTLNESAGSYMMERLRDATARMSSQQVNALADTILMLRGMDNSSSQPPGITREQPGCLSKNRNHTKNQRRSG